MKFEAVKGMRDFLPQNAKKKQFIEDLCRKIFEKYGYEPLQTPVLEDFALLAAKGSGGEAIKEEIYYFKDKADRELGMRYDLTVPLGRIVATNPQLSRPFKRYCIGTVYRYDRPGAKRYREFTQADVDVVGAKPGLADFECVQIASEVMNSLGLDYTIKVNNRQVLEELALKRGIAKEQINDAFRIIDKLDKIGENEVRKDFRAKKINDEILQVVFVNSFEQIKEELAGKECIKELESLLLLSKEMGIAQVKFDMSLCRGLEYYTGNVFEISIKEGPSVGGGGRYDKLIGLYGGQESPAVGISFGIDRLYDTLEKTLFVGPNSDVFIAPFSEEFNKQVVDLASLLRKGNCNVEIDLMQRNIKKNLEYADRKGIPFVIVIGEDEKRSGKFKVKDLSNGEQKEFSFSDCSKAADFIKGR